MRLLIVHHTPSPTTDELLASVRAGAGNDAVEDVEVEVVPALHAGPAHVLAADGYLLGTPANLGYMSGALKHFLDQVYYPCLGATEGRPWGLWVHGNSDVTGAVRAVTSIVGGLGWTQVAEPVEALGDVDDADLDRCWELGAVAAAHLAT